LLSKGEIETRVLAKLSVFTIVGNLGASPTFRDTFTPISKLSKFDKSVTITSPVIIAVPVNEDSNSGKTDICTNNEITSEDPWGNNGFIVFSGRFVHDFWIRRVE